jgi:hypothetical protein
MIAMWIPWSQVPFSSSNDCARCHQAAKLFCHPHLAPPPAMNISICLGFGEIRLIERKYTQAGPPPDGQRSRACKVIGRGAGRDRRLSTGQRGAWQPPGCCSRPASRASCADRILASRQRLGRMPSQRARCRKWRGCFAYWANKEPGSERCALPGHQNL